nr:MAG: GDSL-like Lipase/Acylhydrolase family protein [Bacteriophage sp.]
MSTIYDKTDNYALNLYGDSDPADLRDGYNGSMRTIDTTLETHLNRIEAVESRETHDEEVAKALLGDNTVDNAAASKAKWDKAGTDATAAAGKADNNSAILAALGADTAAHATDAKTKWDKAGVDATTAIGKADSNKTILTALGADTTAHATANKTKWDKNTTDITTLSTLAGNNSSQIAQILEKLGQAQYEDGYLVTFGDSYADNTRERTWSYQLSTMFPELQWKNYAKSGAGFNVSGIPTFAQQVANCVADTSVDNAKVKVAVCAGGRNDILDWTTGITKAREVVLAMESAFPNAIVVIAPMLFDHSVLNEEGMNKYDALFGGAMNASVGNHRVVVVDSAYVWCKSETGWFPSGDIHPNATGAKVIAKYLYTACRDSYRGRQAYAVSKFGDMQVEFKLQNGIIVVDGQGEIPSIGQGKGGTLAGWATPRHNIWTWIVTGGSVTTPTLGYIAPSGDWGIYNASASNQGHASFMASYAA